MVTPTWHSQGAYALSRHYEPVPVQANSWSLARNSQEDWPRLLAYGCGHPEVPPGSFADWQAMASEFTTQKISGFHHSWVDWCGKKLFKDRKLFLSVLGWNSQTWDCQSNRITTQPLCHSHTRMHACTNACMHKCMYAQMHVHQHVRTHMHMH